MTGIPQDEENSSREQLGEEERAMILQLGQEFIKQISLFATVKERTIPSLVVLGAMDYVTKLWKRRIEAISGDFTLLERIAQDNNIVVPEPYNEAAPKKQSLLSKLTQK